MSKCAFRGLAYLVAAVGVSVGVGCGGDDSSNSGSGSGTTGGSGAATSGSQSGSGSGGLSGSQTGATAGAASNSGASGSGGQSGATGSTSGASDGGTSGDASVSDASPASGLADSSSTDASSVDATVGDASPDSAAAGDGASAVAADSGSGADSATVGANDSGGTDGGSDAATLIDAAADAPADASSAIESFTFDTTTQGWWIDMATFPSAALAWNGALGNPTPGALQATIPFTAGGQAVTIGYTASPIDVTGRVLTMSVYLESGLSTDASNPGHIQVFAQTGASNGYKWLSAGWTGLSSVNAHAWIVLTLDFTAAVPDGSAFDLTNVTGFGLQILTGNVVDSGSPFTTAVIDIDSVTIQ